MYFAWLWTFVCSFTQVEYVFIILLNRTQPTLVLCPYFTSRWNCISFYKIELRLNIFLSHPHFTGHTHVSMLHFVYAYCTRLLYKTCVSSPHTFICISLRSKWTKLAESGWPHCSLCSVAITCFVMFSFCLLSESICSILYTHGLEFPGILYHFPFIPPSFSPTHVVKSVPGSSWDSSTQYTKCRCCRSFPCFVF